mmetsp:Transcript_2688/g.6454  ORF Transcript_2688/g.6454 Transcript_2688/m.6454 type:complete len:723 (-) Transcript_2688:450-2618(-)|eukprot:CAMPEP_0182949562 /NCGR_PEP_ID=MMETSP0105_2-20130417/60324_1 /TAXON_ID=81532 ORGANISM="Acanthoeca-like sp., Strain 10tr" /NCGR_SAMPLE_ID=MMETSP0105_2 /ASSEMBLY_ACC=CAM_ASM_000205 /LENGTH=722 /DNA_ID=CAMNT_0025089859 /DNA_START=37 /DNA_END=2205 /DNA_ORIENTATION=+
MGKGKGCCSNSHENENEKSLGLLGPTQHRSCTNPLIFLLWIAFCIGWFALIIYGYGKGDPYLLLNGVDSFGNICGRPNTDPAGAVNNTNLNMEEFPFVYYAEPTSQEGPAVCVAKCPFYENDDFSTDIMACTGCTNTSGTSEHDTCGSCAAFSTCISSTGNGPYAFLSTIPFGQSNNGCPGYAYGTRPIIGRCFTSSSSYNNASVPESDQIASRISSLINNIDYTTELYDFFYEARYQVLYSALFALGLTLVLLLILRWIAGPLVYLIFLLTAVVTIGATAMLWSEYRRTRDNINDTQNNGGSVTNGEENNRDFYLAASILATIFTAVLLFIVIAMRNRIRVAIKILKEGSTTLQDVPALFLSPFITYAWLLAFLVLWMYATLLFMTMKEKVYDPSTGYYKYQYGNDPDEDEYKFILAYHIFALFWLSQFIIAAANFTISGTTTAWYFTSARDEAFFNRHPEQKAHRDDGFFHAVKYTIRYHLGTIAFGSLVLAILDTVRLIVQYIKEKYNDSGVKSRLGTFILVCCQCCLWCLKQFLVYVNKNAYIVTNIHGYSFCHSMLVAFNNISHNLFLVTAVNSIAFLIIFLCKVMVSLGTGLFVFMLISSDNEGQDGQTNFGSWFIILFSSFVGWMIATMFLGVYSTIVDTLLMCLMEDLRFNVANGHPPAQLKMARFIKDVASLHPDMTYTKLKNPNGGGDLEMESGSRSSHQKGRSSVARISAI